MTNIKGKDGQHILTKLFSMRKNVRNVENTGLFFNKTADEKASIAYSLEFDFNSSNLPISKAHIE